VRIHANDADESTVQGDRDAAVWSRTSVHVWRLAPDEESPTIYKELPSNSPLDNGTVKGPITEIRTPIMPQRPNFGKRTFIPLARWEGEVTERMSSYFAAHVQDLDKDESAMVEFDIAEVSGVDLPLCEPGALFYWTVGYDVRQGGQRIRASVITFRR
jgi:hypothetical protein